ncbi:leucyl aminopeptidase family protein [Leifsonia poae]|uniref:leucyl aminopeptidase family protein n=1 Tax=Leifsonia poae TaxID=110933 RepID=UPI001CBD4E0E|nr:M17 family metallopeptidase [Leifsonia poae]
MTTLTTILPAELAATLARSPGPTFVAGLFQGVDGLRGGRGSELLGELLGVDPVALAASDPQFEAAPGERAVVVVPVATGAVRVVLVGLGRGVPTVNGLFDAALAAAAGADAVSTLALEADPAAPADVVLGAVAQGHAVGLWRYRREAEGVDAVADAAPGSVVLVDRGSGDRSTVLDRAATVAVATSWVRQLVETPPNRLGPRAFADAIGAFAARVAGDRVAVSIWDEATLIERGFGATLGVGAGSVDSPLVVELTVAGDGPSTALAGKGITFDSGGTNLKRDMGELSWMKSDMAAAAAVAAAVISAAALGAPGPLHALLPVAENMPGGGAQRPGDVVRHPGGRTTEIVDTDCEGRLVLADALSYLARENPARLIDVGTLTDSGGVGHAFWGCWGTSDALAAELVAAGLAAGDPGWALPLHDSYRDLLSSRVADIANSPIDVPDSGQLAATYLRSFVGETAWVHIDNGSSAWLERDASPWPAGATGTPVRALIEFLAPVRP